MEETLQIGYAEAFGGDESVLVVWKYENQGFNVSNGFRNDEADLLYRILTEGRGMAQKDMFNKENFLKTEFGGELECTIATWDQALENSRQTVEDKEILKTLAWCQAQWEVYRMAIRHFYGVEYHFTRNDEYYGLCTEDESDWLFKKSRELKQSPRYEATKEEITEAMRRTREQLGF